VVLVFAPFEMGRSSISELTDLIGLFMEKLLLTNELSIETDA